MAKRWSHLLILAMLVFVSVAGATHELDMDDQDLDHLMMTWSSTSRTTVASKQDTQSSATQNTTQTTSIKSVYLYIDEKHKALNKEYSACGEGCNELIEWVRDMVPEGTAQVALDWLKYGLTNPILIMGRGVTMLLMWFLVRVVWARVMRILRWIKSMCCSSSSAQGISRRGAKGKSVRFACPISSDQQSGVVRTHALVRIFVTPETHNTFGYIGVYMHTDNETGNTTICHYPFTRPEHVELAKSRLQFQSTQVKCRPLQRSNQPANQMILFNVQKRAPVKLWSAPGGAAAPGNRITIDKMEFSERDCIYSTTGRRRDVPVIDVYGVIHPSMRAFLCNSEPLTMYHQAGGIVPAPSKGSTATKVIACADDVCSVKQLAPGTEAIQWTQHDLDDIKQNTERLVKILKAKEEEMKQLKIKANSGEIGDADAWDRLVTTCSQFSSLISQIDPGANSSVFCWTKRFFGFLSFATQLHTDGPAKALIPPPTFDLEQLSRNTNIEYGEPMDYAELCKVARPGDMIAVHGVHAMSRIICNLQGKIKDGERYLSHVILLVDTTVFWMPGMIPGELYGIEACTGGGMIDDSYDVLPDVFLISRSGVQVRSLRGLLSESAKQHSLYLWCPLNAENRAKFDAGVGIHRDNLDVPCKLVSNLPKYLNKPYTLTPANFFVGASNSKMNGSVAADAVRDMITSHAMRYQSPMGSEYFCSELVGDLYIDTGILQPKRKIPHGANLGDLVTADEMAEHFFVGRQLFPLDYFLCHSKIPYLFDPVHVIHPTQTSTAVSQ